MILETVISLFSGALRAVLSLITLPVFPEQLKPTIEQFVDLVFGNLTILPFFVRMTTVKVLLPVLLGLFLFDHGYRIVMWIIRKVGAG